jgi:hypothetical protein
LLAPVPEGCAHEHSGKWVTTTGALIAAVKDEGIARVVISGRVVDVPTIRLSPGRSLCGAADGATIAFTRGADGVELSSDNGVHDLHLCASPEKRAIFNNTACTTWVGSNCTALPLQGACKFSRAARFAAGMSM